MKKAKIALTSIAVLTIVGGFLAFKAQTAFTPTQALTQTSTTLTSVTIGTAVYTATIPVCALTNVWIGIGANGIASLVRNTNVTATNPADGATIAINLNTCVPVQTLTTNIQ